MADRLKRELGTDVELVEGGIGEWSVRVDGAVVAKKGWLLFPSGRKIVEAVRQALNQG